MKFWSFNVVEGLTFPLTFRSTRLPFKSKTEIKFFGSSNCEVFSMSITWTSFMYSEFIVKTPKILASRVPLFVFMCWEKRGSLFKYRLSSYFVMVLMMNLRSWEKKKKEPLRPAPSPDLNIISRLYFGLRESWKF